MAGKYLRGINRAVIRIRVDKTIKLTQEQYDACVKLSSLLGFKHDDNTDRQAVKRMLTAAVEDRAYYAHEELGE